MPYKVRQFLSSFIVYRKDGKKAMGKPSQITIWHNIQTKKKKKMCTMHKGERRRAGMKARKSKRRFIQAGTMYNQRFYREKLSNKVEKRGILGRLLFLQCEQEKKCGKATVSHLVRGANISNRAPRDISNASLRAYIESSGARYIESRRSATFFG